MSWMKRIGLGCAGLLALGTAASVGLVGFCALTWESKLAFPETPYPALTAATDPEAVARGEYLVRGPAHCAQCHSTTDRARPDQVASEALHGGLAFDMGPIGSLYARNLTPDAHTGIGRRRDDELARVLRTGVLPEGDLSIFMRLSAADLSDDDIRDVLAYLRAQPAVDNAVPDRQITLVGAVVMRLFFPTFTPRASAGPTGVPAADTPSEARGEYLAEHVMLCTGCHTRYDPNTFAPVGPKGGGGTPEPSHGDDSDMEYCPPNLTAHASGVTGKLSEEAFVARFAQGRAYASSIMPWESFAHTTDSDLRSVYRYLRSLPPVPEDPGPSYRKVGWTPE